MEYFEQEFAEEQFERGAVDSASVFTLAGALNKDICPDVYVVQPGDTYYGIATKLGITVYQLSGLNPYVDPDALQIGQQLCIPLLVTDSAREESCQTSAKPCDYMSPEPALFDTSGAYTNPERSERQVTPMTEPDVLESTNVSAVIEEQPRTQPDEMQRSCLEDCTTMAMPQGWNYYNILIRYGISYEALQRANPDMNLDTLTAGQIIYIPPAGSRGLSEDHSLRTHIVERSETLDMIARKFHVSTASLLKVNPNLAPDDFVAGRVILVPGM